MMRLLILILAVLFAFGCAPVEGVPTEYGRACDESNDDKVIEVKGFLDAEGGLYCSNTGGRMDCGFKLKSKPGEDEKGFSADVATGSGSNTMDEVRSGFEMSDLVVRNDKGERIDLTKTVTVTGELNSSKDVVSKAPVCYLKVYKIEQ